MALIKIRSGNKVGWEYYDSKQEAQERSKTAITEAGRLAAQRYDFGYCVPGSIRETEDGLWEVCIP